MESKEEMKQRKVGLLAQYNQDWEVTRYIDQLLTCFAGYETLVLAEDVPAYQLVRKDGPHVRRCWQRSSTDFSDLARAIREESIQVLHVDCRSACFGRPEFQNFFRELQGKGIKVVAHIHDSHSLGELTPFVVDTADAVYSGETEQPDGVVRLSEEAVIETENSVVATDKRRLRVLMQNRPNALSQPGGDTVIMKHLIDGLLKRGHVVDLDLEGKNNPADYDLVHLYNFATPDLTEQMARRCHATGTEYLVSVMYEDWPIFHNQMTSLFYAIKAYVDAGQPQDKWANLLDAAKDVEPIAHANNEWTANHSAALLATGAYEAEALRRDYPQIKRIETLFYGYTCGAAEDGGESFRKETGLTDFVLCVGRLELRKNQLMLLKALEESDLTVVFATGGFTYQPEYEDACRRFKRKGKTVFLKRLEPAMLASAYSAARVHALPSWFELPGLVSLEAAHCGTNVVATAWGTARDYLGDFAYYCSPDDDRSIYNAMLEAYSAPTREGLAEHVRQFSWDRWVEGVLSVYFKVLDSKGATVEASAPAQSRAGNVSDFSSPIEEARVQAEKASESVVRIPEVVGREPELEDDSEGAVVLCGEGDALLKRGCYDEAREKYEAALGCVGNFARALRSLGVLALQLKDCQKAESYFRKALSSDDQDTKALLGLGAVEWEQGKQEEAFVLYQRAAEKDPDDISTVLYMVNAGYSLGKLSELEKALRRSIRQSKEEKLQVQYCLAGCYYRQEKYNLASGVIEHILQLDPTYAKALELKEEIEKRVSGDAAYDKEDNAMNDKDSLVTPGQTSESDPDAFKGLFASATSVSAKLRLLEGAKKRKEYEQVLAYVEELLKDPMLSQAEMALATILKAEALGCTGETMAADSEFSRVESDVTYGYRALSGRGALAAALQRWEDAKGFFNRALMIKPDYDVPIAGLGICHLNSNDQEKAWDYFEKALAVNCENLQALHGIVQLGYVLKRLEKTETALINYLDLNPADLSILYAFSGCLYAQGKLAEAMEECRKIVLLDPEHELGRELLQRLEEEVKGQAPVNR